MIPSIQDLDRRGIQYTIRTHLINQKEEAKQPEETDAQIRRRVRNERWQDLARQGWSRMRIAERYGVNTATVSKAIGKFVPVAKGRPKTAIEINGKRYRSQQDALKKLKIGYATLVKRIEAGRARYVG